MLTIFFDFSKVFCSASCVPTTFNTREINKNKFEKKVFVEKLRYRNKSTESVLKLTYQCQKFKTITSLCLPGRIHMHNFLQSLLTFSNLPKSKSKMRERFCDSRILCPPCFYILLTHSVSLSICVCVYMEEKPILPAIISWMTSAFSLWWIVLRS